MKPLPAVGLASSIIQIVDFSVKITSKDHKIYQPTEGDVVENHTILQDIANNLYRLTWKIDQNDLKKLSADSKKGPKLSEAAEQLLKISVETKELTTTLINAILQAQARGTYSDPKWQTGRDALLTVWKKKEITGLKKKLKNVRKDVEIVLLIALRQYLDQSAETGLPVFSGDESARIHHWERWQNDAMDSIHANDWKPKNKKNLEEFSEKVDSLIQAENEAHFCTEVFARLHFSVLDDRSQSIAAAHEGTFEWLFDSSNGDSKHQQDGNLLDWLGDTSGQNLFWVTGKPGSGKSTLMKHLLRNPRLFPSLEAWSGASPGITAGFFFWNSGTELQVSSTGLLRSLLYESLQDMLYGPLEQDPGIIQWLFADRWNQFTSYGGGMSSFTFPDLRRAFELMISDVSKKFFFIIDGLDELDGYPDAVVDLLLSAAKRDNVKICTSSRPMPGFQNAFENRPSLTLDLMMNEDIRTYVSQSINQDEQIVKICSLESDDAPKQNLIDDVVRKASGVFLWASLSTEFLLQGASESDDVVSIQARLWALPTDLEALLLYIFQDLAQDKVDLQQVAQLFRLVDAHGYPTLLALSFANDPNTKSSHTADIRPLRPAEVTKRVEDMLGLLKVQCRNFLTVFEALVESPDEPVEASSQNTTDPGRLKVNYAHRCIKDFVQSRPVLEQIHEATGQDLFNPDEYWANASLWALKTLRPHPTAFPVWEDLAWCIEYALRLEEKDGKVRVTYLDEVGRAGINEKRDDISVMNLPEGATAESFMDLAVWLNITGYARIKAKSAERKEIRHAIEYNKLVRKRLGTGGEDRWIGERRRLKVVYANTSPELYALLEYYAKPVRFATPKPFMEMPEQV